jgi:hypothetical protein
MYMAADESVSVSRTFHGYGEVQRTTFGKYDPVTQGSLFIIHINRAGPC